jgi:hypothetical protein
MFKADSLNHASGEGLSGWTETAFTVEGIGNTCIGHVLADQEPYCFYDILGIAEFIGVFWGKIRH